MSERARMLKDEDGSLIEIVFCRATACNHHVGQGRCNIVHTVNGDDKISVGPNGICESYVGR